MRFLAIAARGTEEALARELVELRLSAVEALRGAVSFEGVLEDAYRACLWSRIATRVILPLAESPIGDAEDLYTLFRSFPWEEHLSSDRTFAIDVVGKHPAFNNTHFAALKAKDGVVDRFRAEQGDRPSIDPRDADLRLHLYLQQDSAVVSLDLGGRGMHQRTGRRSGSAPLKETLAAAILRIMGWEPGQVLIDPMCGSGTFLIEAALIASKVAPGLRRGRLGAMGWLQHDARIWDSLLAEAKGAVKTPAAVSLFGSDESGEQIDNAIGNAVRANVRNSIRFSKQSFEDVRPEAAMQSDGGGGFLIINPPYGERLGVAAELGFLYEQIGDSLKAHFGGFDAWILSGNSSAMKRVGLKAAKRVPLFNGPIDCRLMQFPITARVIRPKAPADIKVRAEARAPADAKAASPDTAQVKEKDNEREKDREKERRGPGWRKPSPEASMFQNRLRKNLKKRRSWAKRNKIGCYRLYDADIPEYNLSVDWYEGAARIEEYRRPHKIDPRVADQRLHDAVLVVEEVLGLARADVSVRVRERMGDGQHNKRGSEAVERVVHEADAKFLVNLDDYLDTGLFLDDREIRAYLRKHADGLRVLNLFSYTCAASVSAALGGAASTLSVDLSQNYLDWGRRNFEANGLGAETNTQLRTDILQWLERDASGQFDLVLLAPPSFSRSKAMKEDLDVQHDHPRLLRGVARLLAPAGKALFTTNRREFELKLPEELSAVDLTAALTPEDFKRSPRVHAWELTLTS